MPSQPNYCFGYCLDLLVPPSRLVVPPSLDEQQQRIEEFCRDKLSHLSFGGCYVDGHYAFRRAWMDRNAGQTLMLRAERGDAIVCTNGFLLFAGKDQGVKMLEFMDAMGWDLYLLDMKMPHANPYLDLALQIVEAGTIAKAVTRHNSRYFQKPAATTGWKIQQATKTIWIGKTHYVLRPDHDIRAAANVIARCVKKNHSWNDIARRLRRQDRARKNRRFRHGFWTVDRVRAVYEAMLAAWPKPDAAFFWHAHDQLVVEETSEPNHTTEDSNDQACTPTHSVSGASA